MRIQPSLILCLSVFAVTADAAKNAEVKPLLTSPASVTMQDEFDRDSLGKNWFVGKGEWSIVDGSLVGKELAADKHAAVAMLKHPNTDSAVKLSFKLDGAEGFSFSLNHKKGHLFRVVVMKDRLIVRTDRDKKDPKSKVETLDSAKADFAQGQWHTLLIEMKGDAVAVSADNGATIQGTHDSLATEKTGYRLVLKGESLIVDDVHVWDIAN